MLFRAEALDFSQRDHTEGRVLLRSPRILWACTLAALLATLALLALLFSARHTPHIRLSGHALAAGGVELLAAPDALPHLYPGRRVALHYPGRPAIRSEGTVKSVSALPRAGTGAGSYPVVLTTIAPVQVQAGMEVQAELPLPPTGLLDWIRRPAPGAS